jgi:hypothetical protein
MVIRKAAGFAGARLCLTDGVIARKGMRQDLTLYGRAKLKAQRIDALLHGRIELQSLKFHLLSGRGVSGLKRFALRGGIFLHNSSRKK